MRNISLSTSSDYVFVWFGRFMVWESICIPNFASIYNEPTGI